MTSLASPGQCCRRRAASSGDGYAIFSAVSNVLRMARALRLVIPRGCRGLRLGPSGGPIGSPPSRKLRRVNESVDGYEPGGRTFESCWAHQINNLQRRVSVPEPVVNNWFARVSRTVHAADRAFRNRPDSAPIASEWREHLV